MKKIGYILSIIICLIIFTGCSLNKPSVSGKDFYEKTRGIVQLYDYSNYYGIAKTAYQTQETEYKVLYIEANNISDIKGMYIDEAKNIYDKAGISDDEEANAKIVKKTLNGKNYSSLEVTNEINYYYLIYVDNTLLYMECTKDKKELLSKVKDAVNY